MALPGSFARVRALGSSASEQCVTTKSGGLDVPVVGRIPMILTRFDASSALPRPANAGADILIGGQG
jgi:hypothetical protein